MITVDPNRDFDYFIDRLATDRALTAPQEQQVLDFISANCSGTPVPQIVRILSTQTLIQNPVPQTSSMVIFTPELDRAMKVMIRKGQATIEDFQEEIVVWDPNYVASWIGPSPLETLGFETGTILTERDVRRVLR